MCISKYERILEYISIRIWSNKNTGKYHHNMVTFQGPISYLYGTKSVYHCVCWCWAINRQGSVEFNWTHFLLCQWLRGAASGPMMTPSNRYILRVTDPLCGVTEFPSQRPVTRRFDVFFDLRLNKRLSKPPRRQWLETPSRPLCRHRNVMNDLEYILADQSDQMTEDLWRGYSLFRGLIR